MATTVSIDTTEGSATINSDSFGDYNRRAIAVLSEIAALQEDFKVIVQEASDNTKLKKAKVAKFFKSRFDAKTKDVKQLGDLFTTLDDVLDN